MQWAWGLGGFSVGGLLGVSVGMYMGSAPAPEPVPPRVVPAIEEVQRRLAPRLFRAEPEKNCDEELAIATEWCAGQVWAVGGALPVEWPESVEEEWGEENTRASVEEMFENCPELADRWHQLDCVEYPCALFLDAGDTDFEDCAELPGSSWAHVRTGEDVKMDVRFFYPPTDQGRHSNLETFERRENTRAREAWDQWEADRLDEEAW